MKNDITVDLRERINGFIKKVDHSFGLSNYNYILEKMKDERVKDIYRTLGPFDHWEHYNADDDMGEERSMTLEFDKRKSGAAYRGQVHVDTLRPDGFGIKIYPKSSVFEGRFSDGKIYGWGRGITSRGEIYQGPFNNDMMHG